MTKSNGIVTKKIGNGQKIMSAYPQDTGGDMDLPNTRGGSFGGSTTNLGHSLNGASAVQEGAKSK